jgi:predicted RNase H-like HicB family nuclease
MKDFVELVIETEQEEDGRWIAEVLGIPGVLVYGVSRSEAMVKASALALRVMAERLEEEQILPAEMSITFAPT